MISHRPQVVRWVPAYVALGSNLDDPHAQVQRAIVAIGELPGTRLVLRSPLYRSAPLGPVTQPDFVNAVVALLTRLEAPELLRELKALEKRLGRAAPVVRWGPRLIDLDLLMHGTTRIDEESITVPHPGIAQRAFVLVPWAQISPALEVPGVGRVGALAQTLGAAGLQRIEA